MRARDWTPHEDETLKRLLDEGATQKTIAQTIGRSMGAVAGRVARLKSDHKFPARERGRPKLLSKPVAHKPSIYNPTVKLKRTHEPEKTKSELRAMLAEAVKNTR